MGLAVVDDLGVFEIRIGGLDFGAAFAAIDEVVHLSWRIGGSSWSGGVGGIRTPDAEERQREGETGHGGRERQPDKTISSA